MVREYLYAEQLAEITPWSMDAIDKMVRRGTFKRGVHYFQPQGRGTKLIFKWPEIARFVEQDSTGAENEARVAVPHLPKVQRGVDVGVLQEALQRLLD